MGIARNRLWGITATAGLAAILTSLLVPVPAAHAEDNGVFIGSKCADITVIGMRGSSHQELYGGEETQYNENDEEVQRVKDVPYGIFSYAAEALRVAAPAGKTVKFTQVDYEPVDEFIGMGGTLHAAPEDYAKAINDGSKSFVDAVNRASLECSSTSIVVFGYGQGAGVIKVALDRINNPESIVKAGWFIGDPIHNGSGNEKFEYYDAGTGWDQKVNGFTRMSQHWFQQDEEAEQADADISSEDYAKVDAKDIPNPLPYVIPADLEHRIISMCAGSDAMCSPSEKNNVMDDKSTAYLEKDFLSHGAEWVMKTMTGGTSSSSGGALAQNLYDDSDIMSKNGTGAVWVAENKNDPYEFSSRCISDFAIIAARGSGEDANGSGKPSQDGNPPSIPGYSDILATAAWGVKQKLPSHTSIQFIPIKYPANPVPFVTSGAPSADLAGGMAGAAIVSAFFGSAIDGGESSAATVRRMLNECPDTKILVMGYSQGAWAVHLSLEQLTADERSRISGVYLIADPLRDSNDKGAEYFDSSTRMYSDVQDSDSKNSGLGVAAFGASFANSRDGLPPGVNWPNLRERRIPDELKGDVFQVCNMGDGVCNFMMNYEGGFKLHNIDQNLPIVMPTLIQEFILGKVDETARQAKAKAYVRTAIDGFTKVHPVIYKDELEFWAYPPAWGANKLTASYYEAKRLPSPTKLWQFVSIPDPLFADAKKPSFLESVKAPSALEGK